MPDIPIINQRRTHNDGELATLDVAGLLVGALLKETTGDPTQLYESLETIMEQPHRALGTMTLLVKLVGRLAQGGGCPGGLQGLANYFLDQVMVD
jgi:hypothetical protein